MLAPPGWPATRVRCSPAPPTTPSGARTFARAFALLSEIPERWAETVRALQAQAASHRTGALLDAGIEYLHYQTLVGAWPLDAERAEAYLLKAALQRKERTSWTRPDQEYETALGRFVRGTLGDPQFVAILERLVAALVGPGRQNALAQTLIKLTAPGVTDIYQGTELWDLHLVDPDNRRPVDFERRRRLLRELEGATAEAVLGRTDEGLPKLWVIRQALALRSRRSEDFGPEGGYLPLTAEGPRADHLVGFFRGGQVATLVPRWPLRLGSDWAGSHVRLPPGSWCNQLTGESYDGGRLELARLFTRFPVALLARQPDPVAEMESKET